MRHEISRESHVDTSVTELGPMGRVGDDDSFMLLLDDRDRPGWEGLGRIAERRPRCVDLHDPYTTRFGEEVAGEVSSARRSRLRRATGATDDHERAHACQEHGRL